MQNISADSQKLARVISNILNKMKVKTGDVFLVWRMRELAAAGKIEMMGDWNKGWKEISLKLAGVTPSE